MTNINTVLDQLASEGAAPQTGSTLRFAAPLLAVLALCAVGVALVLDGAFASMARDGMGPIAVKWSFSVALLTLCGIALLVLGKPGRPSKAAMVAISVPFVPILALLALELSIAGPLFYGETWRECLAAMLVMSPIAFTGAILGARTLAPTNLRRAGLVAGLFGGAVAMTAYAPFCPERGMGYLAVFYLLPILTMAGVGWALGPRLLRW
ncbi:DUF1109 domain-containing protein [Erythrobacter alti]|uniref:DUF1109 domain-containing protein n=1 Tax=Erythrobacter alti TaxID=1896145 RepID=UPI0030F3911F